MGTTVVSTLHYLYHGQSFHVTFPVFPNGESSCRAGRRIWKRELRFSVRRPHHLVPYVFLLRAEPLKLGECRVPSGKLKTTEILFGESQRQLRFPISFLFDEGLRFVSGIYFIFYNVKETTQGTNAVHVGEHQTQCFK